MFEVWDKSNYGSKRNNYLSRKCKSLFMEIIPWIPLWLFVTHNFLPFFFVYTPFVSMNNIFSHIIINSPLTHSISSSSKKIEYTKKLSCILFMTHVWACSLCSMEVVKILPFNQWPPHPSWTNENWKWFDPPMKFRMKFFVPNEALKWFHPPIKIRW